MRLRVSSISYFAKRKTSRRKLPFAAGRQSELGCDAALLDVFHELPSDVQRLALKNYNLWRREPHHPSLRFSRLQGSADRFTIRIGDHHRAIGVLTENTVTWVWIGTHAEYDRLVGA
jgi:hypothetical protein